MTIEQAYENYRNHIQNDKELFRDDLINCLKAIGMWEVDVIRNHDGAVGRLKVLIPKTPWYDPKIEFFKYLNSGELSKNQFGKIPYKNAESFLKDVFRLRDQIEEVGVKE